MIGVSSSSRSFRSVATYLATGRSGQEGDRIGWIASRNLPTSDPGLAARIMRATAAQNVRVQNPVYHLALSFDPGDQVDRMLMERVADRITTTLGLQDHQVLIVAHRDRGHPHMHLMINRVHPETGKVWDRWQDQRIVQQVLRDEERALGLREVQGRLTTHPDRTLDPKVPDQATGVDRTVGRNEADDTVSTRATRGSRVVDLTSTVQAYERVQELVRDEYLAQLDVAAARANTAQLDSAVEHARATRASFERALHRVYSDPNAAHTAYFAAADEQGMSFATRLLRERPEIFGPLLFAEKARAFGLLHVTDHEQARSEARAAALAGRKAAEAQRVLWSVIAASHGRLLEHTFARALGEIYEEPSIARITFERIAVDHGIEQASIALREHPHDLGAVRSSMQADSERLSACAERAATRGVEWIEERTLAQASSSGLHGQRFDLESALARAEVERASVAERRIRTELHELPTRPELERRIGYLANRLMPHELRRFEQAATAPQLAIARKIKAAVRGAVLGKDDERNR